MPTHRSSALFLVLLPLLAVALAAQGTGVGTPPPPTPVTVAYDAQAYPHIFSSTDAAAFYAFGRSQFMEFPIATSVNMALASGELAAWVGPGIHVSGSVGLYVQTDVRTWRWRIPQRAVQHDQKLDGPTRAILLAYTQGLNESRLYWLANASQLANATEPAGFPLPIVQHLLSRPITLLDVLANGIQMNGNVAMFEADKLANDPEEDYVQDAIRTASNSWLIGAGSSASGKPILLADPHIAIDKTTQMRTYFAQISGSSMDVCGMTFPGWPCIAIGFNSDYGWAVTANNPDIVDVYKAPELPNLRFPFDAGTKPIIEQPLTLGVYDLATQTVGTYSTTIAWAGDFERPILRRCADLQGVQSIWYGHASFTTAGCLWKFFHDMARATDVLGARAALDQNTITYSNFLIGDRFGNKGYFWSGRVPRRRAPTPQRTWAEVQDGTKSAYQWVRVHPASELPWEYQPAGISPSPTAAERDVWIQCNVLPDLVRPQPTIDPADYPEYMVHWTTTPHTNRQARAEELLRPNAGPLGMGDSQDVSLDQLDLWWRAVGPFVGHVHAKYKSLQATPGASAFLATMNAWNLDADVNSPEAGMSLLLYTFYVDGLAKAAQYGLTIAVPDRLPRPGQLDPALAQASPQRYFGNEMAFHYALAEAAKYYPLLLDPLLPGVTSPVTPWTPTPWAGLSTQLTVAGHIKYLDLTPSRNPLEFAIWPVGGTADNLWTLVTNDFKKPSDAFFTQFGLLGQVGPFMTLPVDTGSHTMLQIELGSPPQAFFLEAVGPTERVDNPARYANAADFAAGNYKPFPCDQSTVFAESTLVDVLSFAPTTDGSAGAGGTGGSDGGL